MIRRLLAGVLVVLAGACAPADGTPGADVDPSRRPPDGVLRDTVLQRIVELQEDRDGVALREFLDHDRTVVRARAAFALGSVQDTSAVSRLLELLHDLDPRVRADAAFALGQMDRPGLATPLFNALKVEWDERALRTQLEAVGKRCETAAGDRLFQITDPRWRGAVNRAMARCVLRGEGGEEMWDRLAEDLTHPDPEAREWAAYAFGRHPDPGAWLRHRLSIWQALSSYAADDWAAMHLLRALGRARDRLSWNLEAWWARNGARWQIRAEAFGALGGLEVPWARARLLPGLEDPSVHVRVSAVQGLADAPPEPVVEEALRNHLRRHPGDLAVNGIILEFLARGAVGDPVLEWFDRPDLDDEAVLLTGVRGAAALEGDVAVRLLAEVAGSGSGRASRAAMDALERRWQVSRAFESARPVFFEVFTALARDGRAPVTGAAAVALRDSLFAPLGAASVLEELETGSGSEASDPGRGPRQRRRVDWAGLRALGTAPRLHLETERGRVVLALRTEEAPLTVDGITALAREGRYDGVPFHRVVPNFVVQGGDVTLGGRRVPAPRLRSEFTRIPFGRGVVGMASAGKDTETSQYFITHSPQPHLDGGYTAFGWVVEGLEVMEALAPEDRVIRAWVEPGGRVAVGR